MAGLQAMSHSPEDAEEVAKLLGIKDTLDEVRRKRVLQPQSYVYLVDTQIAAEQYYKIGKSVEPHTRLDALRSGLAVNIPPHWEGQPIRPLALRLGGLSVESAVHADLRTYRLHNTEWFLADLAVQQYIVNQDAWNEWDGTAPNPDDFSAELHSTKEER